MKKYIHVFTAGTVGSGSAGFSEVDSGDPASARMAPTVVRSGPMSDAHYAAERVAYEAFRSTGDFPGLRAMSALVRVDGGRAVLCMRRGRVGW